MRSIRPLPPSFSTALALALLLLAHAPGAAQSPCEEPPLAEHVEVNLGSGVPVPILPDGGQLGGEAPFGAIGFSGHRLNFQDGGAVGITLAAGEKTPTTSLAVGYVGGSAGATYTAIEAMPSTTTFLSAGKGTKALTGLPNYGALESGNLYPGVVVRHSVTSRQLRTTYELAPGTDPGSLGLQVAGAAGAVTDPVTGILSLSTGAGTVTLQARLNAGGRFLPVPVADDGKGVVRFDLASAGGAQTLETVLSFAPYFHAPAAAAGPNGVVAVGQATGAATGTDAVILGLDEKGSTLRWMTVLAGDGEDRVSSVAVSPQGRVYVTGTTSSANFPLAGGGKGTSSVYVAELAGDGSRIAGGAYLDDHGVTEPHSVTVDTRGDVLVAGRAGTVVGFGSMDFTTLLPAPRQGEPAAQYFLARLDPSLGGVTGVAGFPAADAGPPLELAIRCDEVEVGYCEVDPAVTACAAPFFVDPYSISVFGVFEDGFVDTVTEGWGYHALRWKAEFKAATYTPMVLSSIPTGLVESGDQNALIAAEANTNLFPVDPGGPGPQWSRLSADTATALATGAAMSMDLFQTPAYTNLRIAGSDVPAAIVEVEFCVDENAGQSLRELCDITVDDLGLGWFQVDIVDSACALQHAGAYFVDQVFVSDWASGYTEGRVFADLAAFETAYDVLDPGTDEEIYIVDPPVEAEGTAAFLEEFTARFESHIYEPLPIQRTVYSQGRVLSVQPAVAKVKALDLRTAER